MQEPPRRRSRPESLTTATDTPRSGPRPRSVKAALGGGAAILATGLLAAPAAQASTGTTVPCDTAKLIAAIGAANSGGGATINLAPGCTYRLTAANNTDPMLGATGLPVITIRITLKRLPYHDRREQQHLPHPAGDRPGEPDPERAGPSPGERSRAGRGIFNVEGHADPEPQHGHRQRLRRDGWLPGAASPRARFGTGPARPPTTLNFSHVNGNTTSGSAGGILNHGGTLILNFSQVNGNTAAGGGGGIARRHRRHGRPRRQASSC